ncbi:MAG: hypothetical protein E6689_07315 [Corynebacterium striatum]|uniref:hypothetical protein n=1 Tax=Corynebacterium simulans TaxID=146827 RepID=UPI002004D598|nr:hypothetical protein [Corynebacterium simulans]MCK6161824.1 hypothetical protein [Corynebacterium simulans]MDU3175215.1 hypothetical protein [Corynebacterium striatum]
MRTQKGFVYAAFVTDVYSWRICRMGAVGFDEHRSLAAASAQPNELIHTRTWADVVDVEISTLK